MLSVKFSGKPTYSTRRRKSVSKPKASSLFPRASSDTQLSVQSDSSPPSPGSSTHSVPSSTTASETASVDEHNITMNGDIETHKESEEKLNRTLSMSSTASDSSYCSESDSGELSPREEKRKKRSWHQYSMPNISEKPVVPPVKVVSGAATIRKRLYASNPGKRFVAVRDYRPEMAGELALVKGDEVEGMLPKSGFDYVESLLVRLELCHQHWLGRLTNGNDATREQRSLTSSRALIRNRLARMI